MPLKKLRIHASLVARLALVLGWALLGSVEHARAQVAPDDASPSPVPVAAEPHFQSPRALVEWILDNQGAVEQLRAAFDTTSSADVLAATRDERERRLVRDLLRLFELRGQPELSALPALDVERLESGTFLYGHVVRGLFTMTPYELGFSRDAEGRWRFDRATVLRIEGTYRAQLAELNGLRHYVPARLQRTSFLLEHWQWFGLGVLLFIAVALDRLSRFLSRVLLRRLLGASRALDVDVKLFVRPVGLFIGAFVFRRALDLLDLELGSHGALVVATGFVLTVAGVWAAWCLVDVFCGILAERASRTDHKFDEMSNDPSLFVEDVLHVVVIVKGFHEFQNHARRINVQVDRVIRDSCDLFGFDRDLSDVMILQ